MVRKFEYTNILGWSHSRYNTFQTCKRKYYYTYYSKWDRPENRVKINTLRNLTSIALEIGNITHKIIYDLLKRMQKSAAPIDRERFASYSEAKARNIFSAKIFQEIYYEEQNEIDFENRIYEPVIKALTNFLESERLEWLFSEAIETKDNWYLPSENDEDRDFGECRVDNMKAYCKVDCLFPVGNELHVIDWKTGKFDQMQHGNQLRGYAAWASFHFEKTFDKIKPTAVYLLPEYIEHSVTIQESDIEEFAIRIRKQTDEMYAMCEDPDDNIPLAKTEFPLTDNTRICDYCNFRELCDRI